MPVNPAEPDIAAVEVGVKFRSDNNGFVTGVRFYKGSGNTGTHVGHLWSAAGANLGTVTFTGESATGWQTATFAAPIAITADTTYIASYYAPNGRYAADDNGFAAAGVDNEPPHALRDGADGGNGVYRYGAGGGFPTNTWSAANYWVDVVFDMTATDTTPPALLHPYDREGRRVRDVHRRPGRLRGRPHRPAVADRGREAGHGLERRRAAAAGRSCRAC